MYKESAMKNGLPSHFTKKVEEVVQSHEGHYVYLKEGEEQFVSGDLIARTLSGTAQEVNEKLDKLEFIGGDNVALSVVGKKNALDLIEDFGRQIIQKRG
jgi:hypothetical protein